MAEYNLDTIKIDIEANDGGAADKINKVADALERLNRVGNGNNTSTTTVNIRKTGSESHTATKKVNALSKALSSIGRAMGRIAFYRLLRSAIKAIGEAFKEGAENAYNYASRFGDATKYIATSLDSLSGATFKMQNQLGAAWATLLAEITPVLMQLIDLITRAAAVITQFFAAFGGKSTYLQATDYAKKWTDATKAGGKAAKEWKNQLLGFDEINRLEAPASGGGGSGSNKPSDWNNMFKESAISSTITDFVGQIKSAFMSGDWNGLGKIIGGKIDSVGKYIYDAIKKIDFVKIGTGLAQFINGAVGSIDFTVWGYLLVKRFTMAIDFFIGLITELDWGLVAKSIGDFLIGAFDEAGEWLKSHDWEKIGSDLLDSIKSVIENIDFNALATSFFTLLGTAFGALVGLLSGLLEKPLTAVSDFFENGFKDIGKMTWEGFVKGITEIWSDISKWCKEHIIDPFVKGVKDGFGIHSPSTVMAEIGGNVIQGLWNGIKEGWEDLKKWWDGLSLPEFHIPMPHFEWTYSQADGLVARALELVGLPATIPHLNISWYAQGGFPDSGEMFMARENGPELVGRMGNRSAVINNAQIISGVAEGVFEAVVSAMGQAGSGSDRPIVIMLDGKEIARSTTKYQNQMARATG